MTPPLTLPGTLPGVREAATEAATAIINGLFKRADRFEVHGQDMITVATDILCDLTRPASVDWWARWLAERVGMTVGATAPGWRMLVLDVDLNPLAEVPKTATVWEIQWGDHYSVLFGDETIEHREGGGYHQIAVPGISALTDPRAALRLACLHVGGGP